MLLYESMNTINTNRVIDAAGRLGDRVHREFGTGIRVPGLTVEKTANTYADMQAYGQAGVLVVPTAQNMRALSEAGQTGKEAFGVMVGGHIRPAVVTPRSTPNRLDLTYLIPRDSRLVGTQYDFTQINPKDPVIDPSWAMLLSQAGAVQNKLVGADHAAGKPMGTELGHTVLSTAALSNPAMLNASQHPVHAWTESPSGIAGAVTERGLYDFKLSDGGTREVAELTTTIDAGTPSFLLKIGELDSAMQEFDPVPPADLAAAAGLIAVRSRVEVDSLTLQNQLLANMRSM